MTEALKSPPKKTPARRRVSAGKRGAVDKVKKFSRRHIYTGAGAFVALITVLGIFLGYKKYVEKKVLAEFDGGEITREEFLKSLTIEAGKYDPLVWQNAERSQKIKTDIMADLIKDRLLLAKAEELGIGATDAEFREELDSYKSGYTDQMFEKMLAAKGITCKDWSEKKKSKYLIQKLVDKEVFAKIPISDEEVKKYYNNRIDEFTHPEQVRARQILVNTLEEAQKIEGELNAGGNFAQIAKDRSIGPERWKGGDLGYFSAGVYPKVFDLVCFNLPAGSVSQPVKSEYGYHIFKVIDKRGPSKETLEEAKNYIIAQLRREKSKEAFEKWYQPIYDSADIKINESLLKRIEVSANVKNEANN